ncbi:hypothetical protein E2C01_072360 [Portunus trituberculatus]|uniref:Uncharacterized protein n=1 Tax=Portunus trituberculatus TaxID=210409 RepID=A0A5B7HXR9_PORTR|nr:hypothetical protein [Portunus trituberculatus]
MGGEKQGGGWMHSSPCQCLRALQRLVSHTELQWRLTLAHHIFSFWSPSRAVSTGNPHRAAVKPVTTGMVQAHLGVCTCAPSTSVHAALSSALGWVANTCGSACRAPLHCSGSCVRLNGRRS